MKYPILILCLSLTFAANSYSQVPIGIKAGLNINDILIENAPFFPVNLFRPNIGFHVGLISKFSLMNPLSFNPELIFIQRGANSSKTEGGIKVDYRINLNYLELPLLLSINSTKQRRP